MRIIPLFFVVFLASIITVFMQNSYSMCNEEVQITWRLYETSSLYYTYQWTASKTTDTEGCLILDFYFGMEPIHSEEICFYRGDETNASSTSSYTNFNPYRSIIETDEEAPDSDGETQPPKKKAEGVDNPLYTQFGEFEIPKGVGPVTRVLIRICNF